MAMDNGRATVFWGYIGQISYRTRLPAPAEEGLLTSAAFGVDESRSDEQDGHWLPMEGADRSNLP